MAEAILIVLNGTHGHGFSVQASLPALMRMPGLLRAIADEIERDAQQAATGQAVAQ
jgi:hypothetical protein